MENGRAEMNNLRTEIASKRGFTTGDLNAELLHFYTASLTPNFQKVIDSEVKKTNIHQAVALQFRTFADDPQHKTILQKDNLRKVWPCIKANLDVCKAHTPFSHLFLTSDDMSIFKTSTFSLSDYGTAYALNKPFQHTDNEKTIRPGPISDWYLLGEAKAVICTWTTYCQTAIYRKGRERPFLRIFQNINKGSC